MDFLFNGKALGISIYVNGECMLEAYLDHPKINEGDGEYEISNGDTTVYIPIGEYMSNDDCDEFIYEKNNVTIFIETP